jgi:hypothetical protein
MPAPMKSKRCAQDDEILKNSSMAAQFGLRKAAQACGITPKARHMMVSNKRNKERRGEEEEEEGRGRPIAWDERVCLKQFVQNPASF